jgi:preprotein translocase subunit YajC
MIAVAAGTPRRRPDLVAEDPMSQYSLLIVYIAVFVGIFYFLMYRPQMNRQKAQAALLASLSVDDQVVTAGGIYGTIRAIEGEIIDVEVAPGVVIKVAKAAVARKLEA